MRHPELTGAKTSEDVAEWNALAAEMGEPERVITAADSAVENRARRAIQEYSLNEDGITYEAQGYALPGGGIPYYKTLEHLIISDTLARERNSKNGRS